MGVRLLSLKLVCLRLILSRINQRAPEAKDSWKEIDVISMKLTQDELLKKWKLGIPKQLIENANKIIKVV
jgi:hypothetical protein